MKRLPAVVGVLLLAAPAPARAEVFTRDTLKPLLIADVNALQANHHFIQSMLAFDSTPFTVGFGNQQARADFLRVDGQVVKGALNRSQFVLSVGTGRPATDFAVFGVFNANGVFASSFPSIPFSSAKNLNVFAETTGAVLGGGLGYKGWVLQGALLYRSLRIHSDSVGRFTRCSENGGCLVGLSPARPGAPAVTSAPQEASLKESNTSKMLALESLDGYSTSVLFADFDELAADGTRRARTKLASLRALAQPRALYEKLKSSLGVGLTTYAPELDYYGDQLKETRKAVEENRAPPPPSDKNIVEMPLLAERIGGHGWMARLVLQGYPSFTPRLGEIGYVYEGDPDALFLPQAGARAKVFRRGDSVTVSSDAYLGFFWVTRQSNRLHEGRGLSAYISYSYNSPDASNFIPLADAHVLGFQLVWGNPAALAPPLTTIRTPRSAQRTEDVKLSDEDRKKRRSLEELEVGP